MAASSISDEAIDAIGSFLSVRTLPSFASVCSQHWRILHKQVGATKDACKAWTAGARGPAKTIGILIVLQRIHGNVAGISQFLYDSHTFLSGSGVGNFLAEPGDTDQESKRARSFRLISGFLLLFDFGQDSPARALCRVLRRTRLPPSSGATQAFLRQLAKRYLECKKPGSMGVMPDLQFATTQFVVDRHLSSGSSGSGSHSPPPQSGSILSSTETAVCAFAAGRGRDSPPREGSDSLSPPQREALIDFQYTLNPGFAALLACGAGGSAPVHPSYSYRKDEPRDGWIAEATGGERHGAGANANAMPALSSPHALELSMASVQPPTRTPPLAEIHGFDISALDTEGMYMLLYALIILNTDMRSPSIAAKKRLGREEWSMKVRCVAELACLPLPFCYGTYQEVAVEGFRVSDEVSTAPVPCMGVGGSLPGLVNAALLSMGAMPQEGTAHDIQAALESLCAAGEHRGLGGWMAAGESVHRSVVSGAQAFTAWLGFR